MINRAILAPLQPFQRQLARAAAPHACAAAAVLAAAPLGLLTQRRLGNVGRAVPLLFPHAYRAQGRRAREPVQLLTRPALPPSPQQPGAGRPPGGARRGARGAAFRGTSSGSV